MIHVQSSGLAGLGNPWAMKGSSSSSRPLQVAGIAGIAVGGIALVMGQKAIGGIVLAAGLGAVVYGQMRSGKTAGPAGSAWPGGLTANERAAMDAANRNALQYAERNTNQEWLTQAALDPVKSVRAQVGVDSMQMYA